VRERLGTDAVLTGCRLMSFAERGDCIVARFEQRDAGDAFEAEGDVQSRDLLRRSAVAGDQRYYWAHFDGATWGAIASSSSSKSVASLAPAMTRAPILATATPVALATKGTVREARGFTSRT